MAVSDIAIQAPAQALHSLRDASARSPEEYRPYLEEAVNCYESGAYRGAVLMVWSAVIEHIYSQIEHKSAGYKELEKANYAKFGNSKAYRKISKKSDLLYLSDANFFLVCEEAGIFNRNARSLLAERLVLRNRCGHPTGYVVGREETVVFIESLINNVINGAMINWK